MSFTERNVPTRSPAGPAIPSGVRGALLSWFRDNTGISPTQMWGSLCQREGFGDFGEIEDDIRERFGDEDADAFISAMKQHWDRDRRRRSAVPGVDYDAEPALASIPAPFFLDALEYSIQAAPYKLADAVAEINRHFEKRGIYYRFDYAGKAEWHGDAGAYAALLRPALDALNDPRLGGARSEFDAAMSHLRAGSAKDQEDAVEEAGKSVESAMKVALQEHHVALPPKATAWPLFGALAQSGIVVAEADHAVLGAARLRNEYGAHGAGAHARQIPAGVPDLAVHAAATALLYLTSVLP